GVARFSATGLWAKGSHVFDDEKVELLMGSAQAHFAGQGESGLQLVGSFSYWKEVQALEPMIRRQNTRVLGEITGDYHVVDLIGRLRTASDMPLELVADYCWNTAIHTNNKGLWLGAALGSVESARVRVEYTYADVDKDATLAAFATDDFFWSTGWRGHRAVLQTKASDKGSVALIGQYQQFKDSPRIEERDHWVKRFR